MVLFDIQYEMSSILFHLDQCYPYFQGIYYDPITFFFLIQNTGSPRGTTLKLLRMVMFQICISALHKNQPDAFLNAKIPFFVKFRTV